jgi:hypothetical protein
MKRFDMLLKTTTAPGATLLDVGTYLGDFIFIHRFGNYGRTVADGWSRGVLEPTLCPSLISLPQHRRVGPCPPAPDATARWLASPSAEKRWEKRGPNSSDRPYLRQKVKEPRANGEYEWESWECEEFQLDEEYLQDANEHSQLPWRRRDGSHTHWEDKSGLPAVAFVVPLVELHNEKDTQKFVIGPFFQEIQRLLKT